MLTTEDESWLFDAYPRLLRTQKGVAGQIQFTATYKSKTGLFRMVPDTISADGDGIVLSSQFNIRIEERSTKALSALPALYVEDVEPTEERHFGQGDKSACLCAPLAEGEFLKPEFHFRPFMEQLVIPFLYGQTFYSAYHRWPWAEYAHGAAGLLEAYGQISDQNKAEECLNALAKDRNWLRIKSALEQEPHIKGHTPCFCPKGDHIRRCHQKALQGALQLQRDVRALGIPLSREPEVKNVSFHQR